MSGMKQLKLSYPAYSPLIQDPVARSQPENMGYHIESVVGDVDFKPGQFVDQKTVRDLCAMTGIWTVTMVKRKD